MMMFVESVYVLCYLRGLSQLIKDDNIPMSFKQNLFEMQNNKKKNMEYDTVVCGGIAEKRKKKNTDLNIG